MTSVLRRFLPGGSSTAKAEDHEDDDNVEYSFAVEYSGPPVSQEIPKVVPVDIRQIPTAAMAARAVMLSNLSLPVIQPIGKRNGADSNKQHSSGSKLVRKMASSRVHSEKTESRGKEEEQVDTMIGDKDHVVLDMDEVLSSSSSGTLGFSDGPNDISNKLSGSSDVEDLDEGCKVALPYIDHSDHSTSCSDDLMVRSSCEIEEVVTDEVPSSTQVNRVTFNNLPLHNATPEESVFEEVGVLPQRPVAPDMKKGVCYWCQKKNRFSVKEVCVVCGAKYCSKCVIRAMGSMPEGRKCLTCIGYRIDESKRDSLGKCTGMLRRLLGKDAVKQIMRSEILCTENQLPPHLIVVNDKHLSVKELIMLQSCPNPPKKLKPGSYWYDKVSGYWGKEGEKPSQIISAEMQVGYAVKRDVSNGNTGVLINSREITKSEHWMLQAAGIRCEGNPHFWVTSDGSYQHEGMKNVMGKLWDKKRVRLACAALSLPFPSGVTAVSKDMSPKSLDQKLLNKILLVGCDQSGTSAIFKQVKRLYGVPFTDDENDSLKFLIQRDLYNYIAILLEGHEHFTEDHAAEMSRLHDEPGPSEYSDQVKEDSHSLSPRLKAFSTWLLQVKMSGNLEAIFPAATREYSPLVEELWNDKAFQSTYKRRNELSTLPRVADYFLERAVEISRADYEPSQMDILYVEGMSPTNGVACMEFSFPQLPDEAYMEQSSDQNDPLTRYQLIRVHAGSLGEKCKWLEMFEDVDLVIYCASLTGYAEYEEDTSGKRTNKMLAARKLFETIITHPALAQKDFLLVLNKYDLLEEKIESIPLTECEWFQDFTPVISYHPHNSASNNTPLAQRAFHYMAVKYKRLFDTLNGRKLFVARVSGLESDSVDKALRYGKEVLRWEDAERQLHSTEYSTESGDVEQSTSATQ